MKMINPNQTSGCVEYVVWMIIWKNVNNAKYNGNANNVLIKLDFVRYAKK